MAKKLIYKLLPQGSKYGKTNLIPYKNKKGIYRIWEGKKLIYIGSSRNNLYRTIIRHFNSWSDNAQFRRISYKDRIHKHKYYFEVQLMTNSTKAQIEEKEYRLIDRLKPRDNKVDYLCNYTGGECKSKADYAKEKRSKTKKRKAQKKKKTRISRTKARPKKTTKKAEIDDVPF